MVWNPYSDQKNRAYTGILTSLFPEQTKTLPRILVWSIIFLADLILGIGGAVYFGLDAGSRSGDACHCGYLLAPGKDLVWNRKVVSEQKQTGLISDKYKSRHRTVSAFRVNGDNQCCACSSFV